PPAPGARPGARGPGRRPRSPLGPGSRRRAGAAPARQGAGPRAPRPAPPPTPVRSRPRAPVTKPKIRDLLVRKVDPLQLEALTGDVGLDREIPSPEASSPGLVLAGYTARFVADRLHILGETEIAYLGSPHAAARHRALETFFGFGPPAGIGTK